MSIREIIAIAAVPARKIQTNVVEYSQRLHITSHEYLGVTTLLVSHIQGLPPSLAHMFSQQRHETDCLEDYHAQNK